MKKPIIGVLASLHKHEKGPLPYLDLCGLQRDYITAVENGGGVPLIVPVVQHGLIERQVESLDGLVLSGGYDVNPVLYGEEPSVYLEEIHPERDLYELAVIKAADKLGKPLLGICRGLQILNVAYGGSLHQHIPHVLGDRVSHCQEGKRFEPTHPVEVVEGTRLHKIVGRSTLATNSFHHQSVNALAPGFVVNACAKDGVIEGVEMIGDRFVVALQWHPEMMASTDPMMALLFRSFIEAATCGH